MKQHERLEQLATEKEADAAAIRRALIILTNADGEKARKAIGGKLAAAVKVRATNGNGNGNGNGDGHVAKAPRVADGGTPAPKRSKALREKFSKMMKARWRKARKEGRVKDGKLVAAN